MASDEQKRYNKDGCLNDVVNYIKENARKGDPLNVLQVSDEFCTKFARTSRHIGPKKGSIVDDIVIQCKPTVALELGGLWGYSAVRYARLMEPGSKYYSIEIDPEFVQLAREVVEFAGLSERVVFIQGSTEVVIPKLRRELGINAVDFVFIDHEKSLYKPDVIQLEQNGLLRKGSVIAADNVIRPGAPDYLEYVRNSPKFSSTFFESTCNFRPDVVDGVEKSVYL